MFKILRQAIRGGVVTNDFPRTIAEPPDGFRGKPVFDFDRCTACDRCAAVCPTGALSIRADKNNSTSDSAGKILSLNIGDCIFCGECASTCPDVIRISKEFQLAASDKSRLISQARFKPDSSGGCHFAEMIAESAPSYRSVQELGDALKSKIHTLFGRSLHIRQVDAGSCNGCEIEIAALNNAVYDIERFGIHFVASPRHADMLLVTGPVTRAMEIPLRQTYEATPAPKLVIAVGACGIHGGIFGQSYASCGGVDAVIPVDMYLPGCPPRPEALLHGILLSIDRLSK